MSTLDTMRVLPINRVAADVPMAVIVATLSHYSLLARSSSQNSSTLSWPAASSTALPRTLV
jgi:hypothetical protein